MKHILQFEPQILGTMVQILSPERPDARDLCNPGRHIELISLLHNRYNSDLSTSFFQIFNEFSRGKRFLTLCTVVPEMGLA